MVCRLSLFRLDVLLDLCLFVFRFPITFLQSSIKFTNEPPLGKKPGLPQLVLTVLLLML